MGAPPFFGLYCDTIWDLNHCLQHWHSTVLASSTEEFGEVTH